MKNIKSILISTLMLGFLSMPAVVFSNDQDEQTIVEANNEILTVAQAIDENDEAVEESADEETVEAPLIKENDEPVEESDESQPIDQDEE
jgi:Na+-transporting NADH:ubiquinone oxidoreductase subunit NqrC